MRTLTDDQRWLAKRLTIRYVLTAQVILAVSGVLGILLRNSQAGAGKLGNNTFYALMTAHGLGAFIGWAGFTVMGLAFWVFAEIGFPVRKLGHAMAEATYWLMTLGVLGVVVSTLFMHFAGSWVFLYPLPFHSAGQWGKLATAVFLTSVLLVGLAIVTWCLAILDTSISPALKGVSKSWFNKLGLALGFGFLWPKRFATEDEPVPYPVIPLTVIAIDMVIATLPLAVLLVEMIWQTYHPGVHVDPLLAKNVLWWFGHPVVYLLLFPAVAIYYVLVPRLAGRKLVSGNIITVGWTIAVVANVIVWAHHVYIDYPVNSPQAAIDTAMQPLTFSLTIVSALSLYSLFFTIYRSNYKWNAAGTALFLGLVSWLSAGLSGVVNATIAFDQVVHNSLWIVGHFHQMAFLNIGFAAFAAIYMWLPDWVGHPLYSERLAKHHIWWTFIFATANSVVWLMEGLEGAPRRFATLPGHFGAYSQVGSVFAILTGLVQLLFFWNIFQTIRGKEAASNAREKREKRSMSTAAVEGALVFAVLVLVAVGGITGWAIGHYTTSSTKTVTVGTKTTPSSTGTTTTSSGTAAGKALFTQSCGSCHTLSAAGTSGSVGPNLDQLKPSLATVVRQVTNGGASMPAFGGQLTKAQILAISQFVASSAGH